MNLITMACMMIMNAPTNQGHKVVFRCNEGKELIVPINSEHLKPFKIGKKYALRIDQSKKMVFELYEVMNKKVFPNASYRLEESTH